MDRNREHPLYSVAVQAKEVGRKVGIITSVGMNHATPAAFFGHQPNRNMYFELGKDAITTGFDLYGGGELSRLAHRKIQVTCLICSNRRLPDRAGK